MEASDQQSPAQQQTAERPNEMLLFRLRRNRTDEERDIILLEDRPSKRVKLNTLLGLEQQLNKLTLAEQPKPTSKEPSSCLFDALPHQKYLKRVELKALDKEETELGFLTQKLSAQRQRNIRQELIKAIRGQAFDRSAIKIHDIDSSRFMIVNGQKVPFRNIGNEDYEQDYYICRKDPLKIEEEFPVLECPRELQEGDMEFDNNPNERSSADSEDSNDEDNSNNDYPDEEERDRDSYDEEDIYRNDNDSLVDEDDECDNQEDFLERIRRKRAQRRIRREDNEEDDEDDDDYMNY